MKTIVIRISEEEFLRDDTASIVIEVNARTGAARVVKDGKGDGDVKDEAVRKEPSANSGPTFFKFMEKVIAGLKERRKVRTSETYRATLASLRKFRRGEDFPLADLTAAMAEDYEAWLRAGGKKLNTCSFYMRVLKAVYRRAVEEGHTADRKPFDGVFTGNAKTMKRAVDAQTISRIANAAVEDKGQQLARDMFLFSFYTRGMSFIDMAYLRRTDVRDGRLEYCRQKTGQRLSIRWEREMQQIVDRYPRHNDTYLLPIIRKCNGRERGQYRDRQRHINEALHDLSRQLGLSTPLTMYVARHSWATIAQQQGAPLTVISQGMGHDSEKTTQIYLREIDSGKIDAANRSILNEVTGK